jgi:4-amino-4-deoxy-L-arabinose transferase-like glycosyltransferase
LITIAGLVIIGVGLLFRLGYAYHIRELFGQQGNRYRASLGIAENLIQSGFYSSDGINPDVTQAPVFQILLAFSKLLPTAPWFSYVLLQLAVAAIGAWAVYHICKLYSSSSPHALLTAAVFFTHPYLASQSAAIADTQTFASVLALTAFAWLNLQERNTVRAAVGAGFCLGLCFLTRKTTLVGLPAIALCLVTTLWTEDRRNWKTRISMVALMALVTALLITPWGLRNRQLTDHFMIAAMGKSTFHVGNNEFIREILIKDISVDTINEKLDPGNRLRNLAASRYGLGTPKYQLYYEKLRQAEGVKWARNHPGEFLALIPLRLIRMWSWNLSPKFMGEGRPRANYELRRGVMKAFLLPLTLLALLAFCLPGRWNRGTVFCIGILIAFSGVTALFFGFTRYRAPFDAFLIIPAVQGALWLWFKYAKNRFPPALRVGQ